MKSPALRATRRPLHITLSAIILAAGALMAMPSFAQLMPGEPDGFVPDRPHIAQHPQLQFAASAPTGKYQDPAAVARRKARDTGQQCNLQCPGDND